MIMLRTDPVEFAALMKASGLRSVMLDLELPMLYDQGFFQIGPFIVRW